MNQSVNEIKPPQIKRSPITWIHKNLFSTPLNTILTVSIILFLYYTVPPFLKWAIFNAHWSGSGPETCEASNINGACWTFIRVRFQQFIYGLYPSDQLWRLNIIFVLLGMSLAYLMIPKLPKKGLVAIFTLVGLPIIVFLLMTGKGTSLVDVDTDKWGGLMLTLIVSFVGIVASLPLGILLALGRQSDMPVIKALCIAFIELWRGTPLITVLFMASVMIPLFLPEGVDFNKLLRALIGIALFASAYMAEVIRGGLQAIPKGQIEAAKSIGFGYWKTTILIVLPQTLKIVIPGIVNIFIGLFKDTTLVFIVGLFDFLGMVQSASQDPKWIGYSTEGYLFAAMVYFIFCFGMSRYSVYLENKLNTEYK